MARFALTRSASLVGILLGLSVVVFLLEAVVPADPVLAMVGASATPQIVEAKRYELGLDRRCPPARLVRGSASPGCRCCGASAASSTAPATT